MLHALHLFIAILVYLELLHFCFLQLKLGCALLNLKGLQLFLGQAQGMLAVADYFVDTLQFLTVLVLICSKLCFKFFPDFTFSLFEHCFHLLLQAF